MGSRHLSVDALLEDALLEDALLEDALLEDAHPEANSRETAIPITTKCFMEGTTSAGWVGRSPYAGVRTGNYYPTERSRDRRIWHGCSLISSQRPAVRNTLYRNRGTYAELWTALIMSNIGMYMAITIPPITMPMTTIMIGSRIEVSAATAASTSSS